MRHIIWRRWADPMLPLVNGKLPRAYVPEEDEGDEGYHLCRAAFGCDEESHIHDDGDEPRMTGPCLTGPMGAIPLRESNLPSKLFNFWMGDTNFDITHDVQDAMASVPGVESLDVYTRYRFRLAVGRAFDERAVKDAVEAALQPPAPPVEAVVKADPLDKYKKSLAAKYPFWAICVLENGGIEMAGGESKEAVMEKLTRPGPPAQRVVCSWE